MAAGLQGKEAFGG